MPYEKKSKYCSGFKVQGSRFKKSEQKPVAYKPKRGKLAPLMSEDEKERLVFTSFHTTLDAVLLVCSST